MHKKCVRCGHKTYPIIKDHHCRDCVNAFEYLRDNSQYLPEAMTTFPQVLALHEYLEREAGKEVDMLVAAIVYVALHGPLTFKRACDFN